MCSPRPVVRERLCSATPGPQGLPQEPVSLQLQLEVFGANGVGIFPAPSVVADEVVRQLRVKIVGHTDAVRERFYALSRQRRLENPAVAAICERARLDPFARPDRAAVSYVPLVPDPSNLLKSRRFLDPAHAGRA